MNDKKMTEETIRDKQLRLEHWYLMRYSEQGLYTPPELIKIHLVGIVYNHPDPRHHNGKEIITSFIVNVSGRYITTRSGSIYYLGEVDKEYKDWMDKNNINFDPENPIKMIKHEESDHKKSSAK